MKTLNKEQLNSINGGGISIGVGLVIGGIVSFLLGLIDGYARPIKCN